MMEPFCWMDDCEYNAIHVESWLDTLRLPEGGYVLNPPQAVGPLKFKEIRRVSAKFSSIKGTVHICETCSDKLKGRLNETKNAKTTG